ncbi:MAG: hypothetical protein QNJ45_19265 [Ardenticatenaceae bacterium]|nr:hypothetical protein [Ardenticatenaceae bacterium]
MSQNSNVQQTAHLVNTVSQIGCIVGVVAIVIIGVSFGVGWYIDGLLGNDDRKWVTIILMLGSFPVSLYAMIQISLRTLARANARAEALEASKEKSEAQSEEKNDIS